MKYYRRILLLALFVLPVLPGCDSSDNNNPSPPSPGAATFDSAVFDQSTWN